MQITALTMIWKQERYDELRAFLREDQYFIQAHGREMDILVLRKPLDSRQEFLLTLWLASRRWDTKDVIG
jgi:hypothetical protein